MGDTLKSMAVEMSNTYTEVLDGHASPPAPAIAPASSPAPTSHTGGSAAGSLPNVVPEVVPQQAQSQPLEYSPASPVMPR